MMAVCVDSESRLSFFHLSFFSPFLSFVFLLPGPAGVGVNYCQTVELFIMFTKQTVFLPVKA